MLGKVDATFMNCLVNHWAIVMVFHFLVSITSDTMEQTHNLMDNLNVKVVSEEITYLSMIVYSLLPVKVSNIYKSHLACFDEETREILAEGKYLPTLAFNNLAYLCL